MMMKTALREKNRSEPESRAEAMPSPCYRDFYQRERRVPRACRSVKQGIDGVRPQSARTEAEAERARNYVGTRRRRPAILSAHARSSASGHPVGGLKTRPARRPWPAIAPSGPANDDHAPAESDGVRARDGPRRHGARPARDRPPHGRPGRGAARVPARAQRRTDAGRRAAALGPHLLRRGQGLVPAVVRGPARDPADALREGDRRGPLHELGPEDALDARDAGGAAGVRGGRARDRGRRAELCAEEVAGGDLGDDGRVPPVGRLPERPGVGRGRVEGGHRAGAFRDRRYQEGAGRGTQPVRSRRSSRYVRPSDLL
jgi:hypothetical protein